MKKKLTVATFIALSISILNAQQWVLKKGAIMDSLKLNDSTTENFSLYLPTKFESTKNWPIVFVVDMEGHGKKAIRIFQEAAEKQGYILASSNNVKDTLSISNNILIVNRLINKVLSFLPVQNNRVYTAGFGSGGTFASLVPMFIKGVEGVISWGGSIGNAEILSGKNPFYFIGIVEKEDFNYPAMLAMENVLNKMKFPNQLLVLDDKQTPQQRILEKALGMFTIAAMDKGNVEKNASLINSSYKRDLREINLSMGNIKLLQADELLGEVISVYRLQKDMDSLRGVHNSLKKEKIYKTQKRNETNVFFKEALIKEDYAYYLEEDILTHNFNNLGWWSYQMDELKKYEKSSNVEEQQMGKRLYGYINALLEDNMDFLNAQKQLDEEALVLLWMIKTVTSPQDYPRYLKIISQSSKNGDFGTALFYLEELLKNGYQNRDGLYNLENTALLRITPEFNELVAKYLKEARYDIIEK